MSRLEETTVGDVGRWLGRITPYAALVVAVVLVAGVLRGDDDGGDAAATGDGVDVAAGTAAGTVGGNGATGAGPGATIGATGSGTADSAAAAGNPDRGDIAADGSTRATTAPRGSATSGPGAGAGGTAAGAAASAGGTVWNCDPATGRIKIPSRHAPPCVPAFDGGNGGATSKGVSGDTIKVAVYEAQENPAADAILTAAGASDSKAEERQQYREYVDLYESHFETYGRHVELHFVEGSGPADDDAAGRADAIKVADEIGAFASWWYPNNAYIDELVARGVMCFSCAIQQPMEYYRQRTPYVWGTLMSVTALYVHLAEHMDKQLAGKKAAHAGDPLIQQKERAFGLLWYETPDGAYKAGTEFFNRELRRYGIELTAQASFRGYPDLAANQEQARPLIQKMKEADVTSIILAADPFAPIFFTQEATRQQYYPEWIVTGSALTDTTFFGRTYDQQQWQHAFGMGLLTARLPQELGESFRLLQWHFGRGPTAKAGYGVIRAPINVFYTGVHLAGERLTPQTLRDGLFGMPVMGVGGITTAALSFGQQVWPFDDYTALDDVTYIWWDPDERGEDEIGNEGIGMYRYVDGGQRYLPGQHPGGALKAFQVEGTVTVYEDYPPGDEPPEYPHEHRP